MKKTVIGACAGTVVAALPVILYEAGLLDFRWKQKPDRKKIRVACVGDSITYGNQCVPRGLKNYPRVLQSLLGDAYQVENFGLSARTAMMSGDKPYMAESEYERSLRFRPDIVVLKLGTNDTKTFNWNETEFEADTKTLIDSYLALDSKPTVYLCTPAAAYKSILAKGDVHTYKIQNSKLVDARNIVRKIAAEKDLGLIDIAELTEGHRDWFVWDGIHPNAKGAAKLAECIYEAIR